MTFTYDSNGNLIKQSNGLEFLYDHTGVFAVKYADSTYFYRKNAQQDVIALLDNNGSVVVKYTYDAWGNCITTIVDPNASSIANLNPFRYRSYYFDTETGLYYLKTRYYDPENGRFMTIDDISYLDPESINGLNLYAYCLNNPVKYSDHSGQSATLAIILGIIAVVGLITTGIGVATDNNIVTAVGLGMVGISAIISGGIALVGAFATGATLTGVIGGITVVAGVGSLTFMSAEIQEATGNGNWMLDAGMSGGWYNSLLLLTATIATLGTMASSVGHSFNIKSIKEIGKIKGTKYKGIKFIQQNKTGKVYRSLEFHSDHIHKGYKLHWQLNKWSKAGNSLQGGTAWWTFFFKRLP